MTDQRFSIVIRGGTVVLPEGVAPVDIGIRDETLLRSGEHLDAGITEIDAAGRIVTPGGIEQISGAGLLNAGSFESATTSAAFGGTTTVISFAAQHVGLASAAGKPFRFTSGRVGEGP